MCNKARCNKAQYSKHSRTLGRARTRTRNRTVSGASSLRPKSKQTRRRRFHRARLCPRRQVGDQDAAAAVAITDWLAWIDVRGADFNRNTIGSDLKGAQVNASPGSRASSRRIFWSACSAGTSISTIARRHLTACSRAMAGPPVPIWAGGSSEPALRCRWRLVGYFGQRCRRHGHRQFSRPPLARHRRLHRDLWLAGRRVRTVGASLCAVGA